jgi:hypothetical protein
MTPQCGQIGLPSGQRIALAALAFEVADLRGDLLRQQTRLEFRPAGILFSASKNVTNLGQGESELFAVGQLASASNVVLGVRVHGKSRLIDA